MSRDSLPGFITDMDDAPGAVCRFQSIDWLPGRVAVKLYAAALDQQRLHQQRAFSGENGCRRSRT